MDMHLSTVKRAFAAFNKATTLAAKLTGLFFLLFVGAAIINATLYVYENHDSKPYVPEFSLLSSAEHLNLAQDMCRSRNGGDHPGVCITDTPDQAAHHLEVIPHT